MWLGHPLLLTVVGGLIAVGITGLLVPRITRGWQTHDRELDIKNALVVKASRAVGTFVTQLEINAAPREHGGRTVEPAFASAFFNWRTRSTEIGAEILTYFGDGKAFAAWQGYCTNTARVYEVLTTSLPKRKNDLLKRLVVPYLGTNYLHLNGLLDRPRTTSGAPNETYVNAVGELVRLLLKKEGVVAQKIITSPSVF